MNKHSDKLPMAKGKKIAILVIVLIAISVIIACFYLFYKWYEKESRVYGSSVVNAQITNRISGYNFDELKKTFPDIVAWVDIPNTTINMPIVQSKNNDYYYLTHGPTADSDLSGSAYIEMCNKENFDDPVTVVYGHYMKEKEMFSQLHYFEDQNFFNNNKEFYIYTPGHKKTYTVVSAYNYDNRHIINTYDFSDKKTLIDYYNYVINPVSTLKNVRDGERLTENDKIVQLSTCMNTSFTTQRYLVTGKLVKDESTN